MERVIPTPAQKKITNWLWENANKPTRLQKFTTIENIMEGAGVSRSSVYRAIQDEVIRFRHTLGESYTKCYW
jgi:acetyltransferase-like isoleucine patch superfamily enzyme